jgi:hypothetical protein
MCALTLLNLYLQFFNIDQTLISMMIFNSTFSSFWNLTFSCIVLLIVLLCRWWRRWPWVTPVPLHVLAHPSTELTGSSFVFQLFGICSVVLPSVSWWCDILLGNKIHDTLLFVDYICILFLVFLFSNGGKHKSFISSVLVWSYLTAALTYFTILCLGGYLMKIKNKSLPFQDHATTLKSELNPV